MKIIKKNVYYCDYCGKRSLKSLKEHELHCTGNLKRECRLCENNLDYISIIEGLKERFKIEKNTIPNAIDEYEDIIIWIGEKITGKEILDFVEDCPICALTIIKGLSKDKNVLRLLEIDFDYKKELGAFWLDKNSTQKMNDEYSSLYH